jgi:hypothetical protein
MTTFAAQFTQFYEILGKLVDLPDGTKDVFIQAWNQITWPSTTTQAAASTSAVSVKPKGTGRINGYNLYMREQLVELKKDTSIAGSDRMKKVAEMWKLLTPEQKKEWTAKVSALPAAASATVASTSTKKKSPTETKEKTTRKPSGYNLFMKSQMSVLKAQGVESSQRMTQIGSLWKGLSDDQKKLWKDAAANGSAAPTTASTAETEETEETEETAQVN